MSFDPSSVAIRNGNFYGLPYSLEESDIAILCVPWDVTTSYRDGTRYGPQAVLEASYQLDYSSPLIDNAWKTKIGTVALNSQWLENAEKNRKLAKKIIDDLENDKEPVLSEIETINRSGEEFHQEVERVTHELIKRKKKVLTLGGDHSISLGPIRAHAKEGTFSVLHIDAHADLRVAYEGFTHSHASIMNHVKDIPEVDKLVQIGIRDLCPEEKEEILKNSKIKTFFDWDLYRAAHKGESWDSVCEQILSHLGPKVYLSFDIDGLDPKYCPNTGTPVPGGIQLDQFFYLLEKLISAKKQLIGADLVEVAPSQDENEWDANVGARTLFQIAQTIEATKNF
ncbi:MAG: agmatinase family protein [Oligoflexia bacterium]|nr:agmatinase family protein [Oligoflexia bacterium]